MGAGLLVLALGVVALVMFAKPEPKEQPPFERTILWIYDADNPTGTGLVTVLEESREGGTLTAATLPAPDEAMAVFKSGGSARRAQKEVEAIAGRRIHHRVFLTYQVVGTLVDSVSGIELDGKLLTGSQAIAYVKEGGTRAPERAYAVLMAMADVAMNKRAPSMGVSEALALARQIETDMDLTAIPEVLQRWSGYPEPRIVHLQALTGEAVQDLFQPDPEAPPQS